MQSNSSNTIQNSALMRCLGALYSSPIDSIYCEAAELPPDFRRTLITNKFISNASTNPSHPLQNSINPPNPQHFYHIEGPISNFITMLNDLQINPKTLIQKPILYPPWLLKPPQVNLQLINYPKNSHSPLVIKQNYLELLSEYKKFNLCFTDGSKIPTLHSGYAYSINDKISNFKIHNCSSIYTAELTAIFHCLCDCIHL